jgi:hypothetical protein
MTTAASIADDITVTTATRTEDEVRASLGVPAEKKADPPPADDTKTTEPPAATPELEDEADSDAPDPEVSEAARKLRMGRADVRKTRLRDDITLYEDNIRSLGGAVPPPLEKKEYANAQAEIDALSRRKNELLREFNKTLKNKPAAPAAPPKPQPIARPAAPAAGDPKAAADPNRPTFEFANFDEWQAKHPEKDYTDYTDARTDARHEHLRRVDAYDAEQTARVQAEHDAVTTIESAITTFKAEHADYDEVTQACNLDALGPNRLEVFRAAMLREGTNAPALLYHLAKNPAEVSRLGQTRTPVDLLAVIGELRYAARTSAPAAPAAAVAAAAPAAPAKPVTSAPAPMRPVGGSATPTRTAADAAADTEDADEYIARRKREAAA